MKLFNFEADFNEETNQFWCKKKTTKRTEIASPVSSPYQPVDGAPTFERPMNILNIFSHDSQMYIL